MKKNIGSPDRIIRIVVAVLIGILYFSNILKGVLGIMLLAVAAIFVSIIFVSFFPVYAFFDLNPDRIKKKY
jgi:uncharacterized membrane protein